MIDGNYLFKVGFVWLVIALLTLYFVFRGQVLVLLCFGWLGVCSIVWFGCLVLICSSCDCVN